MDTLARKSMKDAAICEKPDEMQSFVIFGFPNASSIFFRENELRSERIECFGGICFEH